MDIHIHKDEKNLLSGITIEADESLFPLTCFFFETPPASYLRLLDRVISQQEFRNEMSGVRFCGDLDEEDSEDGTALSESEVLIEHNEFGDVIIPIARFTDILSEYLNLYCEERLQGNPNEAIEIRKRIDQLHDKG